MKLAYNPFVLATLCFLGLFTSAVRGVAKANDVYLIIYTTKAGYTGHVGVAVDNYKIVVKDTVIDGKREVVYDSVKNHTLTYYDLWGPADIRLDQHDEDLACRYYKLPRSSAEESLTVDYFLTRGLPHSYDYPCDAMVRIQTSAVDDFRFKVIAEDIQQEKNYFNSREYNCTDYVILCLKRLLGVDLKASEYIPFSWSSTPNKFYKEVVSSLKAEIIRKPGPEVDRSFFKERVFNTVLFNQFINHEKNN
jgi:hypothetical protein